MHLSYVASSDHHCCAVLQEGDVLQQEVEKRDDGLTYYNWYVTASNLPPHFCAVSYATVLMVAY